MYSYLLDLVAILVGTRVHVPLVRTELWLYSNSRACAVVTRVCIRHTAVLVPTALAACTTGTTCMYLLGLHVLVGTSSYM